MPVSTKSGKAKPKAKASTAPKSSPMPNGKSVHAGEPTREPNWNPRRTAIVKAMRVLKAINEDSAVTAGEIGAKAATLGAPELADRVDFVKICLDVYRTAELIHNGFAKSVRASEAGGDPTDPDYRGGRELRYYLTEKGRKTTFPKKEKAKATAEANGQE